MARLNLSLEPRSLAFQNRDSIKFFGYLRSKADTAAICNFFADKRTHARKHAAIFALQAIGRHCFARHSAGRVPLAHAINAVQNYKNHEVGRRTAQRYVQDLIDAGVLTLMAGNMIQVTHWDALNPDANDPVWQARATRWSQLNAARCRKHRQKVSASQNASRVSGECANNSIASSTCGTDTIVSFNQKAQATKTEPSERSDATPMLDPAEFSPAEMAALGRLRSFKPKPTTNAVEQPLDADVDAFERETPAVPKRALPPLQPVRKRESKPMLTPPMDFMGWAQRMKAMSDADSAHKPPEMPPDVQEQPAQQKPQAPAQKALEPIARPSALSAPQVPDKPATVPQLVKLAETHAGALEDEDINFVALERLKAPYSIARQAFDAVLEQRQNSPKRVRHIGAYVHHTMRRLLREAGAG